MVFWNCGERGGLPILLRPSRKIGSQSEGGVDRFESAPNSGEMGSDVLDSNVRGHPIDLEVARNTLHSSNTMHKNSELTRDLDCSPTKILSCYYVRY